MSTITPARVATESKPIPAKPAVGHDDRVIYGIIEKYSSNGMAHILEIDSSRPKGKAVWYKPLNAEIKRELQRYDVGDHVIARLRIGTSGVHDTIVKVTTALETRGPALSNGESGKNKPGKKSRKVRVTATLPDSDDEHGTFIVDIEQPVTITEGVKTAKKSRRGLQPDRTDTAQREDAMARLKDTARENVFTQAGEEPKPVKIKCPFCNGPTHDTQDKELLCMNATRFSRKRRRNRGTERATDDDE